MPDNIQTLEKIIGYKFNETENISKIIIDKSYQGKKDPLCTLGDAILRMAILDDCYEPDTKPHNMTQRAILFENNEYLTTIARDKLQLDRCLGLDDGEQMQWDDEMKTAAGDLLEGIIGAMYIDLDRDFKKCQQQILQIKGFKV